MIGNNPIVIAKAILDATTAAGATAPKQLTDAYTHAERMIAHAADLIPGRDTLHLAVIAALDAGRDPRTDPDVQAADLAERISLPGVHDAVKNYAGAHLRDAFAQHADKLISAWRKPFDTAAQKIHDAHPIIGNNPLDDTQTVLARGGDVATHWGRAVDATRVIGHIDTAWADLARLGALPALDQRYPALRTTNPTVEQWDSQGLEGRKVNAWDAELAGITLDLADSTTYLDRIKTIEDAHAAETDRLRAAAHDRATGRRADLAA